MNLSQWLSGFKELHEKAKRGALAGRDLTAYHAARDELARALLSAQHVALERGQRPRQALRVARALQADIEFHDGSVRAMTLSLSAGGFGALLAQPPRVDDEVRVSLRIPGGDPLRGTARTVDVKQQVGNARVAFQFIGLDPAEAERLEVFVFDSVLAQIEGK
jgi:c-di-GMP-binding flagellar brake protein YcgR